jgi:hypothetical protein
MNYKIKFSDGIVYNSPDIRSNDPGWASEADVKSKGIEYISIVLPNKQILTLRGFEKYNFFVEASQTFRKEDTKIDAFYFCGAYRGHVVIWKIDYRTQEIVKSMAKEGFEYNGTPTRGWRMGLLGEKAESGLLDN